jgi:hypothetical protein
LGSTSAKLQNFTKYVRRKESYQFPRSQRGLHTDRTRLLSYLSGDDSIDIADIIDVIRASGALAHCDTLVANLFTQARRNIVDAPHLPAEIRNALAAIWQYMFNLYDPDSEVSRLYLQARPSIQASDPPGD